MRLHALSPILVVGMAACIPAAAQPDPAPAPSPSPSSSSSSSPATTPASPPASAGKLAPAEIAAMAPAGDWSDIAPEDLLVMTLRPDARGRARTVLIQLMPEPFSQPWVRNIRALAKAHWFDGIAVVRVQDNYVVQWGDPDGEDAARARPLPAGLAPTDQADYGYDRDVMVDRTLGSLFSPANDERHFAAFFRGFPVAGERSGASTSYWPMHCYGSVGVGRDMPPNAGTGAELYTVIGQAPRQLDRNIAVVGRIVGGMEHLSSLSRGTGPLGFYEKAEERTPIVSVQLASDMPAAQRPRWQFLGTSTASFRAYADARANRRDDFYIRPAGGTDICNIPVPARPRP